ncbi:NUDIX hydrolase [Actinoallomurus rhizosphaericola]|uniref:NUDIX hydrolase n=1 Tax=Actinoallomurus rhizosphaericola TaxID=2952536 RepID=UPI0020905884|nr:NUDIX domain-containing protein [Actinoallomurus rhizosphaericola]MCO5992494.1 NUDIX domain-containing protein [Actinoallomurus rhizosphaericola]
MPDGPYRRRSARVLLLDDADRVLLLRLLHDHRRPKRGHYWLTPGGGVDDGEALHEAAARELQEEIGLIVAPEDLGTPVATTSGYAEFSWAKGLFRDDFFLYRVTAHEVDTGGLQPYEVKQLTGHRWWTVDELAATTEAVYPFGLVPLLRDLLAGRRPAEPVLLPWHH